MKMPDQRTKCDHKECLFNAAWKIVDMSPTGRTFYACRSHKEDIVSAVEALADLGMPLNINVSKFHD